MRLTSSAIYRYYINVNDSIDCFVILLYRTIG